MSSGSRCYEGQIKFGGVQGSGKTTIIGELTGCLEKAGVYVPVLKGSLIMAAILGCKPDEISAQDPAKRAQARSDMFERLAREPLGIRDGHFTVPDGRGGYEISDDFVEATRGLVVVTASPEVIRERRILTGRVGRELDVHKIAAQQDVELEAAKESAERHGRPLFLLDNNGSVDTLETSKSLDPLVHFVCEALKPRSI